MGYFSIEDQVFRLCITSKGQCQNFHVYFDQEGLERFREELKHAQASGGRSIRFMDCKERGYEFGVEQAYEILAAVTSSGKFS